LHVFSHDFTVPIPIIARNAIRTQKILKTAALPTGRNYAPAKTDMDEECIRRWQSLLFDNEKTVKQVRKYRAEYWAKNQVDDDISKNLRPREDEQSIARIMKLKQLKIPPYHQKPVIN